MVNIDENLLGDTDLGLGDGLTGLPNETENGENVAKEDKVFDFESPTSFSSITDAVRTQINYIATYFKLLEQNEALYTAGWRSLVNYYQNSVTYKQYLNKLFDPELLDPTVPAYLTDETKWTRSIDSSNVIRYSSRSVTYEENLQAKAIIEFKAGTPQNTIAQWGAVLKNLTPTGPTGAVTDKITFAAPHVTTFPAMNGLIVKGNLNFIRMMMFIDGVEKIYLDRIAFTQSGNTINRLVGVDELHDKGFTGQYVSQTGKSVRVAVIDTGVCKDNSELKNVLYGGFSGITNQTGLVASNDDDTQHHHGTHVAGIIHDIAPNAKIYPVKAIPGSGYGSTSYIINACKHVEDSDVHIVNMSLGSDTNMSRNVCNGTECPICKAVVNLVRKGKVVVVAAGNESVAALPGRILHPGACAVALTVGSVDPDDSLSWFSSIGSDSINKPDIVAYGSNIVSDSCGGSTSNTLSGTSQASPYIAGFAALYLQYMLDKYGTSSVAELKAFLLTQTKDGTANKYRTGNGVFYPYTLVGGFPCPDGKVISNGSCITPSESDDYSCPPGRVWNEVTKTCTADCNSGYLPVNGICEKRCKEAGTKWDESKQQCVQTEEVDELPSKIPWYAYAIGGAGVVGGIALLLRSRSK